MNNSDADFYIDLDQIDNMASALRRDSERTADVMDAISAKADIDESTWSGKDADDFSEKLKEHAAEYVSMTYEMMCDTQRALCEMSVEAYECKKVCMQLPNTLGASRVYCPGEGSYGKLRANYEAIADIKTQSDNICEGSDRIRELMYNCDRLLSQVRTIHMDNSPYIREISAGCDDLDKFSDFGNTIQKYGQMVQELDDAMESRFARIVDDDKPRREKFTARNKIIGAQEEDTYTIDEISEFWNQSNGYFTGNWWQDEDKFQLAYVMLLNEARIKGYVNVLELGTSNETDRGIATRKLHVIQKICNAPISETYDMELINNLENRLMMYEKSYMQLECKLDEECLKQLRGYDEYQAELQAQFEKQQEKIGKEHPFRATIRRFLLTPYVGAEGAVSTIGALITGNESWLKRPFAADRESLDNGIKSHFGDTGNTVYSIGTGIGDMLVDYIISDVIGGGKALAVTLMGGDRAGSATDESYKRNGNVRQAAAYGTIVGGAEAYFNARGLSALEKGVKGTQIEKILKAGNIEGLENLIQGAVETVADLVINNKDSAIVTSYNNNIQNGMEPIDAFEDVAYDAVGQYVYDYLTGFGFGTVVGGTNAITHIKKVDAEKSVHKIASDSVNAHSEVDRISTESNIDKSGGNAVETSKNTGNPVIDNMQNRVPNNEITPPDNRGNAPLSNKDGKPIEIHHSDQEPLGPFKEMHPSDHRYGANYKNNHPNYNSKSKIDRTQFRKWKQEYWENEWDNGRWNN